MGSGKWVSGLVLQAEEAHNASSDTPRGYNHSPPKPAEPGGAHQRVPSGAVEMNTGLLSRRPNAVVRSAYLRQGSREQP